MSLLTLVMSICLYNVGNSQLDITIRNSITCGDVISATISDEPAAHYYEFVVESNRIVNFETCNSVTDMIIQIADDEGFDISYTYCNDLGDWCGTCDTGTAEYPENFTMPMSVGTYYIGIGPYDTGGSYTLGVSCNVISASFPAHCPYYKAHLVQPAVDIIHDRNETFEIEFDITLHDDCSSDSCDILHITNDNHIALSLSNNGITNELVISLSDNAFIHRIPTANQWLPPDGESHHFYLSFPNELGTISITIDTNRTYYNSTIYPLFLPQIYHVYLHNSTTNAAISNVCMRGVVVIEGEIKCGDVINGMLSATDVANYYYFNLLHTDYVAFDSCFSSFDTWLALFNLSGNLLHHANASDYCDSQAELSIDALRNGEYVLAITGEYASEYGEWELEVICDGNSSCNDTDIEFETEQYILISNAYLWFDAQQMCEQEFGTALATIITREDMLIALNDIQQQLDCLTSLSDMRDHSLSVWIGRYKDATNASKWRWVDGSSCEYTSTADCMDDEHWNTDDNIDIDTNEQRRSVALFVPKHVNTDAVQTDSHIALCNGPYSKYSLAQYCLHDGVTCWNNINIMNTGLHLNTIHSAFYTWQPPLAYWNSTLFIVDRHFIYHSSFQLLTADTQWNTTLYNGDDGVPFVELTSLSQRYAQYKASLYLWQFVTNDVDVLVHINLNTLEVKHESVPDLYPSLWGGSTETSFCVVVDPRQLYIVKEDLIVIYKVDSNIWSSSATLPDNTIPITCAITNEYQFIYIFGVGSILRYDTKSSEHSHVATTNLCSATQYTFVHSITGKDDKIYLHGCYIASWKTLVFDIHTEEFETDTIDIHYTIPTDTEDMMNYRSSQLANMDDNILLLLQKNSRESDISLYFTVTETISISFEETISTNTWPSDGFYVSYSVNDFSNSSTDCTYNAWFYSTNSTKHINRSMALNTSNDGCICMQYKCDHCSQHFDLTPHLSVQDNDVGQLVFMPVIYGHGDTLILPKYITVDLIRCTLSLHDIEQVTDTTSIIFHYILSTDCFTKTGSTFSMNITAPSVAIFFKLTLTINGTCTVCHIGDIQPCTSYCNNNTFIITHNVRHASFDIDYRSNSIDFRVIPSMSNIQYYIAPGTNKMDTVFLYLLFLLVIPVLIVICIAVYCRTNYMNAFIVDDALVLIIGISQYDDESLFLGGVQQNVTDLETLWSDKYKYDVFVCNNHTLYSNKRDIMKFIDTHMPRLEDKRYKAVIIHLISHGSDDSILSSDAKAIDISFFRHEVVTTAREMNHVSLIKLVFNHGCQGENDYSISGATSSTQSTVTRAINIHNTLNNNDGGAISFDSNYMTISGTISGRTMSDCGHFTKSICDSFGSNMNRKIKADFNALMSDIGRDLERKTNNAEICNVSGTLRYNPIRFEQCKEQKDTQIELQRITD
eukprot:217487_1